MLCEANALIFRNTYYLIICFSLVLDADHFSNSAGELYLHEPEIFK